MSGSAPTPSPHRRLLAATTNAGKIAEIAAALAAMDVEVIGLDALEGGGLAVEETGATFEENARLKAAACSMRTDDLVVADDSGLEVDALDGRPGVLSARYGSPALSDAARSRALLKDLIDVPDPQRTARFRCVLAAARAGTVLAVFAGVVEGRILRELRGKEGFGYDPVFFHEPSGKTFAELSREEKTRVSHRGEAIQKLAAALASGTLTL